MKSGGKRGTLTSMLHRNSDIGSGAVFVFLIRQGILLYFSFHWSLYVGLFLCSQWTSIYKFGLSVCLGVWVFVCLFVFNKRQNGWTDRKLFVGHLGTPGKVYEWSKFQIFVSIKIRSALNFLKFWKSTKYFVNIRELFLFCFTMYTKRTCSQLI